MEKTNEPIAWINKTDIEDGFFYPTILTKMETISNNIPLYTHPAEHDLGIAEAIGFDKGYKSASVKELTDEKITAIAKEIFKDYKNFYHYQIDFARAVIKEVSGK